jgi:acyl carrier protein
MERLEAVERELKELIVRSLQLEDIKPVDIDSTAPLFREGLGLDSIDALELGTAVYKTYGLRFESEPDKARQHFASVRTLAEFVVNALPHYKPGTPPPGQR